jgi:hypothetical protein
MTQLSVLTLLAIPRATFLFSLSVASVTNEMCGLKQHAAGLSIAKQPRTPKTDNEKLM